MEAEASLQEEVMDAVLEAKSCRTELVAVGNTMGNELEEARDELRQAEAHAALQQPPCPSATNALRLGPRRQPLSRGTSSPLRLLTPHRGVICASGEVGRYR